MKLYFYMHGAILRDLNEPAPQDVLQIGRGGGGGVNGYYHVCSSFETHTRTLTHTLMHTHTLSPSLSLSLSQANAQATLPLTVTYQMKKAQ